MIDEQKKEVVYDKIVSRRNSVMLKKINYVIFGVLFLIVSFSLLFISFKFFYLSILCVILSLILFFSGKGSLDYDELLFSEREVFTEFYLKEAWHQEMQLSVFISFVFGGFFFISSILLLILHPQRYFFAILFCDAVGATILIYGFFMRDYEKKIKTYEKQIEELREKIEMKSFEYQGVYETIV